MCPFSEPSKLPWSVTKIMSVHTRNQHALRVQSYRQPTVETYCRWSVGDKGDEIKIFSKEHVFCTNICTFVWLRFPGHICGRPYRNERGQMLSNANGCRAYLSACGILSLEIISGKSFVAYSHRILCWAVLPNATLHVNSLKNAILML